MPEHIQDSPATVPAQREATAPVRKSMPVVIALIAIVALIGIANVSSLVSGKKRTAPVSALPMRPAAPNAQQISSFETQQQLQAQQDLQNRQHQQEIAAAEQQLQAAQDVTGPETAAAPPMTAAQRAAIYGDSPNAPQHTSNVSQAQAEAKQKALEREKQHQDALNSDTVAIDFAHPSAAGPHIAVLGEHSEMTERSSGETPASSEGPESQHAVQSAPNRQTVTNPMTPYDFDNYGGQLYRVFEGTVLEGVVTNHIDGGFSGPVILDLTTDLYSHDHQQLLLPQGTRILGSVQSVGSAQQRKLFVTFHRAICPDGFSLEFAKYIALDQIGTTGLATDVDHGYLQTFAAAALIGGLGGLAQIGNNGNVLSPSTEIRNGISAQAASEGMQVLNHFLNRLPVITLKEGSRARVYIGTDLLIPSYAEHRINPAL
jgi:type IV secretory pathway VirB10-like protein